MRVVFQRVLYVAGLYAKLLPERWERNMLLFGRHAIAKRGLHERERE